jgi:hypothetical protein
MPTFQAVEDLERSAASFGLCFQPFQVGVKLVFGNALASFQFFHAGADFGIDFLAVRCKPFIPFMQDFKGAVNHVVAAAVSAGAQRLRDALFLFGL